MSQLFSQTLREAPTEAETASSQFRLQAGFMRKLAAGIFSYLPLAKRSLTKIENIMREEMNAIGGQEMTTWQETERGQQIGSEMRRFKDTKISGKRSKPNN